MGRHCDGAALRHIARGGPIARPFPAAGAGRVCPPPEVKEEARASARAGGHGVRRTNPSCAGPRATKRSAAPTAPALEFGGESLKQHENLTRRLRGETLTPA